MKKSVIIVEDNRRVQEQLKELLEQVADIKCIGAFISGEEALPIICRSKPDVVLMGIDLPGMSGIQCVAQIKNAVPEIQIIMVTVFEDVEDVFLALQAGASGYLTKTTVADQLINAIRDVYDGGAPMSSPVARKIVKHFQNLGKSVKESESLTPKEREVLILISMGLTYREVGKKLNIGRETVRTHIKKFCRKMHVRSRIEAVSKYGLNSSQPHFPDTVLRK